jgi:hypothetical protein
MLDFDGTTFRFWYLAEAESATDFRPFLGFPELTKTYESKVLWPFFALRIMDSRRPDYAAYLQQLGLTNDASQLDILSRSGGERKGDTVYLVEEPDVAPDGATEAVFLLRGSRYATSEHGTVAAATALIPSAVLQIRADSTNETNPSALLVCDEAGAAIGWVPDLLITYVTQALDGGGRMTVVRNNGPEAPWHLRILVKTRGNVPFNYRAFSGTSWVGIGKDAAPAESTR